MPKGKTSEPKIVAATGTSVTVGGGGSENTKGRSSRIEQAMAEAGAKAMREGKSDAEVLAAKLAARERAKKE